MPSFPEPFGVIAPMPVMKTRLGIRLLRQLLHACERAARYGLNEKISDDLSSEPLAEQRARTRVIEIVDDRHSRTPSVLPKGPRHLHALRPTLQVGEADARRHRIQRLSRRPSNRDPIPACRHLDDAL